MWAEIQANISRLVLATAGNHTSESAKIRATLRDVGKVTAVGTDVVTKDSGHNCVGMAVSVCTTPAAPSPLPMPYPLTGTVSEGITDPAMRTKIGGADVMTVGSCMTSCHGNEPGTLKEVVSLNTAGPCFPIMGAPVVLVELGMAGITGSPGQMNKAITVGAPANASDAGGDAGGGGGGGGGGGAGGPSGPGGPSGGGGGGSSSSTSAASAPVPAPTPAERALAAAPGNTPAQRDAREKVVRHFYEGRPGLGQARADQDMGVGGSPPRANGNPKGYGIDLSGPVEVVDMPPPAQMQQYVKSHGHPGNFFDPNGGQSGDQLGLNDDPAIRQSKTFNVPTTDPKQQGLRSQNGPIVDDWTDPSNPVATNGGGTQMTVDDTTKGMVDPQPQPW